MLYLPHNCRASQPAITPKNWKKLKKITRPWKMHCRFYDPSKAKPYYITDKSMNLFDTAIERIAATEQILKQITDALNAGYNPWLQKIIPQSGASGDLNPNTNFIEALHLALARLEMDSKTKKEISGYIIKKVLCAAKLLGYDYMIISEVKRRHIIFILDKIRETSKEFTNNTFNHFRKYIRILFTELVNIEAIEANVINDIKKKPVEQKERETLTPSQRKYVNEYLNQNYPDFHRFLHIFFHSGSRITELLKLKGSDVDLQAQKFKREIKKGRKTRIEWTPIKNIALPYWTEIVQKASENQYLFSVGLIPGDKRIQPYQITKRWYRLIKQKGIATADFYSLKHLNSTEMVDHLSEQAAATLNGHTTTAMVRKIYDTKQKDREHEKIKGVNNAF